MFPQGGPPHWGGPGGTPIGGSCPCLEEQDYRQLTFAEIGEGSGASFEEQASGHVYGHLSTLMQERSYRVFVVAYASGLTFRTF